jgi:hypothetical protein
MPVLLRALLVLVTAGVFCFADIPFTVTVTDPNFGTPADHVTGEPLHYAIQDFTLTGPSSGGVVGLWTLTIDTNYGTTLPGSPNLIPGFCDNGAAYPTCTGSLSFFMSDFLIQQGSSYYGVVLSKHDNYTPSYTDTYVPGDLYSASGFQNSLHYNPGHPVILSKTGEDLLAAGTLSVAANPGCYGKPHTTTTNGTTDCAEYKITDTFTVSSTSDFFDPTLKDPTQKLSMYVFSADNANGGLVYTPEPSGLIWLVPGLLLLGSYLRRR